METFILGEPNIDLLLVSEIAESLLEY